MSVVRLKGVNKIRKVRPDGRVEVLWYAWRGKGAPRLLGEPGSPEFLKSYAEAHAARKAAPAEAEETLAGLVGRYRAAPEFTKLAEQTKAEWRRWLDRIALDRDDAPLDIGGLPLSALDDRRARADLLAWRDQWADRPRTADYAIQVLSRVLSWSVDRGLLAINLAAGVSQLYDGDRADQIWTPAEIAAFVVAAPSPEVAQIVRLACLTGISRTDLCRLSWSQVGDTAIVLPRRKTRGRKNYVVPIYPELRQLLDEIRARQAANHAALTARAEAKGRPLPPNLTDLTPVLTNTRGRAWSVSGLEHQVIDTKAKAKPPIAKHLHDARGTFVTKLRHAGLKASEIADIVAWREQRVERLLATYVDLDTIVKSIADRLHSRKDGE